MFGSYELLELLGQGGMGKVYRARRSGQKNDFAVKFLRAELVADDQMITRFVQERSLMVSLRHKNLVNVLDLVIEDGRAAIVMEFVGNGDVRDLLKSSGPLSPALTVSVVKGVLEALSYIHENGVVHRDIKPENILLGEANTVKVADFGIARLTDGQKITKVTSLVGTPEYMAPEMADGEGASAAVDVYATGIMMYELLTGVTPFAGGHPVAVLRRHIENEPELIFGLDDALAECVFGMLCKDPNRRLTAAEALGLLEKLGRNVSSTSLGKRVDTSEESRCSETRMIDHAPGDLSSPTVIIPKGTNQPIDLHVERKVRRSSSDRRYLLAVACSVIALAAITLTLTRSGYLMNGRESFKPTTSSPLINRVSTTLLKPTSTTTSTSPPLGTTTTIAMPVGLPPDPVLIVANPTNLVVEISAQARVGNWITQIQCQAFSGQTQTEKFVSGNGGTINIRISFPDQSAAQAAGGFCQVFDRWGRASLGQMAWGNS
jgi:serine/threonine protein kinase